MDSVAKVDAFTSSRWHPDIESIGIIRQGRLTYD